MRFRRQYEQLPTTGSPEEVQVEIQPVCAVPIGEACPPVPGIGVYQGIGKRSNQQDCYGFAAYSDGVVLAVADGMGGLQDSDKVSKQVVQNLMQDTQAMQSVDSAYKLHEMLGHANFNVNRMLGPSNLYQSGSTLVAALVEKDRFLWVSVGDSRIYLYRNHMLMTLNREHAYRQYLVLDAVNGKVPFDQIETNPKRNGLTSFIGMGNLRYVDGSNDWVSCGEGDVLLLMSDGVFHAISEEQIGAILSAHQDPQSIADAIGNAVLLADKGKQDNFTVVVKTIS